MGASDPGGPWVEMSRKASIIVENHPLGGLVCRVDHDRRDQLLAPDW